MPYVIAGLVLVGALCAIDLVLTLGVIRRLRAHSELLSSRSLRPAGLKQRMLPDGETPVEFTTTALNGVTISSNEIKGATMIGFFSPECPLCVEDAPVFAAYAATLPEERRALAVVVGDTDSARDVVASLEGIPLIVVEPDGGPVSSAYQVTVFPVFGLVGDGGMVVTSDLDFNKLRSTAAA
jgi:thiol-disulfide isomerase/thioredoxin